ncbi:FeoA family protein [Thaumasiovibrio subtropicus]|uniref:FeoA family protein n=1 Tax=Thaumasiovibrio subtropicus TaxID=1891207 RepID=UPI000B361317|nr:FeoA family protein [Thaumasiovibrio subtropicus]
MKLTELQCNVTAKVEDISDLPPSTRKRLAVMGLLPDTDVTVIRRAPLGDPLQIRVRGVDLAIRQQLAAAIEVRL